MSRSKTISNPGGLYGLTADTDAQRIVECIVNTTAAVNAGDAVAISTAGTVIAYTTMTTTQTATDIFGVVAFQNDGSVGLDTTTALPTFAVGAVCPVVVDGVALVNISSFTIAKGDILAHSSISGVLQKSTVTTIGVVVAVALQTSTQTGTSTKTIAALLKSA